VGTIHASASGFRVLLQPGSGRAAAVILDILRRAGISCWVDTEQILQGRRHDGGFLAEPIAEGLHEATVVLAILTNNFQQHGPWAWQASATNGCPADRADRRESHPQQVARRSLDCASSAAFSEISAAGMSSCGRRHSPEKMVGPVRIWRTCSAQRSITIDPHGPPTIPMFAVPHEH
jgi:hypothetical protein